MKARRLPLIGLLVPIAGLALACSMTPPVAGNIPDVTRDTASKHTSRAGRAPASMVEKTVTRKEPPYTLIATDYYRCDVNDDTFLRVHVGDVIECGWRSP